jgi:hypothetical protein
MDMLVREIQAESFDRLRDFEDFIFGAGEVTTLTANAFYLYDTDKSDKLRLYWGEDDSATRQLTFKVNAGNRAINLEQGINVTGDGSITLNQVGANKSITLNENLVIGDGYAGTLTYSAASKTLTVENTSVVNQDLSSDASPTFGGATLNGELDMNTNNIDNIKTATFIAVPAATPSEAFTVDWTVAQIHKVTITGTNLDITFTNPDGPCHVTLIVIQGDGSDTIDWANEADIKWPGGTAPTLSTGAGEIDIVSFLFDGTSYYGDYALDFS